jgi:hypothetical protein
MKKKIFYVFIFLGMFLQHHELKAAEKSKITTKNKTVENNKNLRDLVTWYETLLLDKKIIIEFDEKKINEFKIELEKKYALKKKEPLKKDLEILGYFILKSKPEKKYPIIKDDKESDTQMTVLYHILPKIYKEIKKSISQDDKEICEAYLKMIYSKEHIKNVEKLLNEYALKIQWKAKNIKNIDTKKVYFYIIPIGEGTQGREEVAQLKIEKETNQKNFLKRLLGENKEKIKNEKPIHFIFGNLKKIANIKSKPNIIIKKMTEILEIGIKEFLNYQVSSNRSSSLVGYQFMEHEDENHIKKYSVIYIVDVLDATFKELSLFDKISVLADDMKIKDLFSNIEFYPGNDKIVKEIINQCPFIEKNLKNAIFNGPFEQEKIIKNKTDISDEDDKTMIQENNKKDISIEDKTIIAEIRNKKTQEKHILTRGNVIQFFKEMSGTESFNKIFQDHLVNKNKEKSDLSNKIDLLSKTLIQNFFWEKLFQMLASELVISDFLKKEIEVSHKEKKKMMHLIFAMEHMKKLFTKDELNALIKNYIEITDVEFSMNATSVKEMIPNKKAPPTLEKLNEFTKEKLTPASLKIFEDTYCNFLPEKDLSPDKKIIFNTKRYSELSEHLRNFSENNLKTDKIWLAFKKSVDLYRKGHIGFASCTIENTVFSFYIKKLQPIEDYDNIKSIKESLNILMTHEKSRKLFESLLKEIDLLPSYHFLPSDSSKNKMLEIPVPEIKGKKITA